VLRTVEYARGLSSRVTAIHVTDDAEAGQRLRDEWESTVLDVPLAVISSPYRSFVGPVLAYIEAIEKADQGAFVTVVLPEFRTAWPWQRLLHNQSARRLKAALNDRPNNVVIEVPYDLSGAPEPLQIGP
jgi:hypothetical protein